MRYQSKPYRSLSYLQREAQLNKDNKEKGDNKENNNQVNILNNKLRTKESESYVPICKVKLQHKVSQTTCNTTYTTNTKDTLCDQLKRVYTQLIRKDYSHDIITHYCERAETQNGMLSSHKITSTLRSKMVDWMIEVLSSYKMSEQTFFRSVYMMDAYMKNCDHSLEVKDLHLIGVTSMFSATKYEQIHPLKLGVIYDKIARKKFKKSQILEKEQDMVRVLNFKLQCPSVYDIARLVVEQMKFTISQVSNRYFKKIILYLSKMVLFNQELAQENSTLLAGAVVFIALKTLEQVDSFAEPEAKILDICTMLGIFEQQMIETSRKVLELAKNFSRHFPTLTNLKKFNKFEYGTDE